MLHVTRSKPIDGTWVTDNAMPREVSTFPRRFRASNHRVILVDLDFN